MERNKEILLGCDVFANVSKILDLKKYSKVVLITEEKIYNLWKKTIDKALQFEAKILLPTGETTKNIDNVSYICRKLLEAEADRKSLIINLGGGMITDLGGFCASIYMRGIEYINVPTSLLAMVDASIGGKNGINFCDVKNIIGTFNKPKKVIIDVNFLETLPIREFNSAYGEIIKHAIIKSHKYFKFLANFSPSKRPQKSELIKIIQQSLKIKKHFAGNDFKERGRRKVLNFGHTIGHAIEAIGMNLKEPFLHGEAVLLGMYFETKIANERELLNNKNTDTISDCLFIYGLGDLLKKMKENKTIFTIEELLNKIRKDKKNKNGAIKMVLPTKIGKCKYDISVDDEIIKKCLKI